MKENLFAELAPASAYAELKPTDNYATENVGLDQAYFVDTDINVDASGAAIYEELTRDDVTKIGDIAIYEFDCLSCGDTRQAVSKFSSKSPAD